VSFLVSVIIPVYNADSFVAEAVESALSQPETAEVILIEDGSPDQSLVLCQHLAQKHNKVRLLQHLGGENRGAAASRNLGMRHAQYDYIAFLDADDYFLPGRFKVAKKILKSNSECDGVYEAIGKHFESKEARHVWQESNMSLSHLTTMKKGVPPEDLFEALLSIKYGYFSIDGLVIKSSILRKTGYMNEKLMLHEDTDFILKLAYMGKLLAGRINEPVSMRRIHQENRISAPRSIRTIYRNRVKMWKSIYQWAKSKTDKHSLKLVLDQFLLFCINARHLNFNINKIFPLEIIYRLRLILLFFDMPLLIFEPLYWSKFLPLRMRTLMGGRIKKILLLFIVRIFLN